MRLTMQRWQNIGRSVGPALIGQAGNKNPLLHCKGEILRPLRKYICMWIKLDIKLRLYEMFGLDVHSTRRVKQSRYCMKTHVDWQTITVTAESSASTSRVKQFKTLKMEALRSSEMSAIINSRHGVTSQKTWIFIKNAVRTLNLAVTSTTCTAAFKAHLKMLVSAQYNANMQRLNKNKQTLSPQANYTDRAAAAGRRS